MNREKASILLVAKSKKVYHTLRENLMMAFGSNVQIYPYHEFHDLNQTDFNKADLILLSARFPLDSLPSVREGVPVLVARRTVNLTRLEPLMDVPSGTRCLLVSNGFNTSEEAVELLNRLGFDHLHFIPYTPEMAESAPHPVQVKLAVTHGQEELVPNWIERIIDLGNRPLDLTTIFDVARLLNLSVETAQFYTAEFFRDFVRLGRKLSNSVNNEIRLNHKLEAILNSVHEGIIAIDGLGNITVFNEAAEKILNMSAVNCIGHTHFDIISDFNVNDVFESHTEITDQLLETRSLVLLVTKIPIILDGQFLGVVITFQDVTKVQKIEQEFRKKTAQYGLTTKYSFTNIIGNSQSINTAKQAAFKLAASDFTVLITGENGTGKEVFAQAIHQRSERREGPFVPVNFAGLSESLAESELFGYEEGSFTGARKGGKMGLFELAHNGTIFLDEIGDAPLSIQAALLRVLQERQVMRVGGNRVIPVNVRVIAATNRNLKEMIQQGTFREDLYYRLNVLPLHMPTLRERREDLFVLIDYYLKNNNRNLKFSHEVEDILINYNWPGNIRELENFINYLMVIVEGNQVDMRHIPESMINSGNQEQIEDIIHFLCRHGALKDFADILEVLVNCNKRSERIGRTILMSMLSIPLSEAQIRHKLDILNRSGCISVGIKKQGTQITTFGSLVLQRIQEVKDVK